LYNSFFGVIIGIHAVVVGDSMSQDNTPIKEFFMSLIRVNWSDDGGLCQVLCSVCDKPLFWEQSEVVCDMALQQVFPTCWLCDIENSETLPRHLYYLDETFLLGIGGTCFLGHWKTDDLEIRQGDLSCTRISHSTWYDLKTGRVAILDKKRVEGRVVILGGNYE
jgi:hypothetical protein